MSQWMRMFFINIKCYFSNDTTYYNDIALKSSVKSQHKKIFLVYLKWFIEEGFHSFRQTSDQSKWVSQNIQAQDKNIHLFEELQ